MKINLKLKVKKHWGSLLPTNVFWVDDFLDSTQLEGLIHEARVLIPNLTYNDLVNDNEIHLVGELYEGKWNMDIKSIIKPTESDIKEHSIFIAGITEEDFMTKTRREPMPLTRSVVAAAYFHFLNMGFYKMESMFSTDRSTIYCGCRDSLPSFLKSKNPLALNMVQALSHRYGDPSFTTRCKQGYFLTKHASKNLHVQR